MVLLILAVLLSVLTPGLVSAMDEVPSPSSSSRPPQPRYFGFPQGYLLPVMEHPTPTAEQRPWRGRERLIIVPNPSHPSLQDHQHLGSEVDVLTDQFPPAPQSAAHELSVLAQPHLGRSAPLEEVINPGREHDQRQYHIPAFSDANGRRWGPFPLGRKKFTLQSYPLNIHAVDSLDHTSVVAPATVEEDLSGNGRFPSHFFFRPEPNLLRAIHQAIWTPLNQNGVQAKEIRSAFPLLQGEFLWLPTIDARSPDGNGMTERRAVLPKSFNDDAYNLSPTEFLLRSASDRRIYHMNIRLDDGVRHILMTQVRPINYLEDAKLLGDSRLWMLFQGLRSRTEPSSTHIALLGATALPSEARNKLTELGVLKVARRIVPSFRR
ncbi:uncharacterized protein UTRI_10676 [Ustilago trichophora]|uniref:Effector family protein Eff1 n=1 Tax=Ustilago trichophora TaxID=86804 RepID=A0A5C3EBA4_9BASI|nr:uncharacterized protein UTRI_10676 [Ustilago trichophora]